MTDNINPNHYKIGGIETWDYLKAKLSPTQLSGFALGNVIKYVTRADHKNKIEDLKKAKWYLDKIIQELDKEDSIDIPDGFIKLSESSIFVSDSRYNYKILTNDNKISMLTLDGFKSALDCTHNQIIAYKVEKINEK